MNDRKKTMSLLWKKRFAFSATACLVFFALSLLPVGAAPRNAAGASDVWLAGYGRTLAGDTIRYHSSHPKANAALIVRAEDSKRYIEWETAPVPNSIGSPLVHFVWLAGMAAGKGVHSFGVFVDGRRMFTITSAGDTPQKRCEYFGPDGASLVFQAGMTDQFQELFGTMILTLPASICRPGKPLTIRIQGPDAGSRDWVMAFQYRLQERASVEAEQALIRKSGSLFQLVRIDVERLGPSVEAEIDAPGASKLRALVDPGFNTFTLPLPAVSAPKDVSLKLDLRDRHTQVLPLRLKPIARRALYLLPHSHNDIGYSDLQVKVLRDQWRYLEEGIALAKKTASYPPEARFKWNVEILWPLEPYLAQASAAARREFAEAVKNGWVGLEAFLSNELTGLCSAEELLHLTDSGRRIAGQYGLPPITSAMISDIPGSIWSIVPALASAGVKYFSSGPNYVPFLPDGGDRIGSTLKAWGDKPFYWVSPSGREKVLFWMAGRGYSWFHGLNQGNLGRSGEKPILDYVRELADKGYPYDMVQVRYTVGGDNGPPDPALPDMVKAWNEKYESPRLVIATSRQMFEEFERRYGTALPSFAGDMTPYWEDGAMSSAAETVMNRQAVYRLLQAETLWAMLDPASYPADDFYGAWRQALLFDEHTWGASNSISEPDSPEAKTQWDYKRAMAVEADRSSRDLLNGAIRDRAKQPPSGEMPPAPFLVVYNTSSWPRTDLVIVEPSLSRPGDHVSDEQGHPIPSQRLSTGELALLARDVPAFGQKRYTISKGSAHAEGRVEISDHSLDNGLLRVIVDGSSGAISSLRWKERDAELVDSGDNMGLNDFFYVPGRDPKDARRNPQPKIALKESGPLVASLLIESEAPGCRSLKRELRLVQGLDRLEITNVIDKAPVRDKESAHFAFPFLVPGAEVRYDVGWGIVRPGADQLAGSCKDYLSVENWVDISGQSYGLTMTTPDAPLVEFGTITDETLNEGGTRSWKTDLTDVATLFSYVANNYWHTNYKADQEGPLVFRYSILPHGPFDAAAAKRFGLESSEPLVPTAASGPAASLKPLPRITPDSVVAMSVKPSLDGKAIMVRLYNAGGAPVQTEVSVPDGEGTAIYRSSLSEEKGERLNLPVDLPAYGILTLRIER